MRKSRPKKGWQIVWRGYRETGARTHVSRHSQSRPCPASPEWEKSLHLSILNGLPRKGWGWVQVFFVLSLSEAFKSLLCAFSKEKPPRAQGSWDSEPHGVNGAVGSQPGALAWSSKNLPAVPHASALSKQQKEVVEAAAAAAAANLSPMHYSTVLLWWNTHGIWLQSYYLESR